MSGSVPPANGALNIGGKSLQFVFAERKHREGEWRNQRDT